MTSQKLTRPMSLAVALLFVATSIICRLVPWWGLSFLSERVVIRSTATGLVALTLVWLATRYLLKKKPGWVEPGLTIFPRAEWRGLKMAVVALLVGAALFGTTFAGAYLFGGVSGFSLVVAVEKLPGLLIAIFVATILNAAWEELTFRGWPFALCVKTFGPHPVAITLGLVFGLAHLLNPNWSVAAIASVSVAGWLIGYSMLAFRNILVVIGLHVGWNFAQSLLTSKVLWTHDRHPNGLLSGGEYGLEASAIGIGVTSLAAAVALMIFLRRRRQPGLLDTEI